MRIDKGQLASVIVQQMPAVITFLRDLLTRENPTAPQPTSAEIVEGFQEACATTLAVDAAILAAHPEPQDPIL